jgi:MSHA pilin protein MshD
MAVNVYTQRGFTLIELVAGMVIFGIVLAIIATLIAPQGRASFDPLWQTRATELSESLINEISAKAFDEQSDFTGGMKRCGEVGMSLCTQSNDLGPDTGEARADFDDVDDFHGLNLFGPAISDSQGNAPVVNGDVMYRGFGAFVSVMYDDNLDGVNDDDIDGDGALDTGTYSGSTKVITVTITTPGNDSIVSSFVRKNF